DDINLGTVTTAATGVPILDVRGGTITTSIANATIDDYNQYGDAIAGTTTKFKSIADLTTRLTAIGVTNAKSRTYVYCASGMRAAVPFFVLDGVMGWPVTMYDGSWNQWGAYITANAVNTAWRVDTNTSGTTLPRTTGTPTGTLTLDPASNVMYTSITDPRANQILNDDVNYFNAGTTTTTSSGGSSGGSSSGC
ncbi:MAG: hypothetical protein HZC44_08065, partial [Geobacter sp.]|nr:hypothetical protein [Geobacter sp.]